MSLFVVCIDANWLGCVELCSVHFDNTSVQDTRKTLFLFTEETSQIHQVMSWLDDLLLYLGEREFQ